MVYQSWHALVVLALGFYSSMGLMILLPMILIVAPMIYGNFVLSSSPLFLKINLIIFVVGWIFQFVGTKSRKKPSFIEDLLPTGWTGGFLSNYKKIKKA